jgi:predicted polyphosphate/ATP-dependent NAD kinase
MSQERRAKIGFLINPVAGLGGRVGLKGTDGLAGQALDKGAVPQSEERARACLMSPIWRSIDIQFFTAGGAMGESALASCGMVHEAIYSPPVQSEAADTIAVCQEFRKRGIDLILFCGGDGTARDVASGNSDIPMLGIPAGVKMHSGVFAISPQAAAELAVRYLKGEIKLRQTEIVDVDEDLYRSGDLATRLYAAAQTPYQPALVQERKRIYLSGDEEEFKNQIALFAAEFMRDGSAYIIGAGTTTARIAERLGLEKTLLGVDVVQNGQLIIRDATEKDLLALLDREAGAKIIVSPIGAQGFILGRGSQQISPAVLRRVGEENLIIVSTPHKMAEIPRLLVDTGDADLDALIAKKRLVIIGYRMAQRKETVAASLC